MALRLSVSIVLLCALVGFMTSCAGPEKRADSSATGPGAPPELETIGERAPQIVMAAADGNWPQVRAYVKNICAAWQEYKYPTVAPVSCRRPPAALFRGPLDGAMFRLRYAAGKGQAAETMQAAHEVEAATLKLFEYYAPTTPLDLRRLRMLEGRIVLNAAQDKMSPASDAFDEVRSAWGRVRPTIAESRPDALAAFEDSLSAQQAALNKPDLAALAACARQAITAINGMQRLPYAARK